MFMLVLTLVITLGVGFGIYSVTKEVDDKGSVGLSITLAVICLAIMTFLSSITVIGVGEVGIRTRFGNIVGTQLTSGLKFKTPFIEKITKINVRVQKIEKTGGSASKDLQDVKIAVAVNYRVESEKVKILFKNVGVKYQDVVLAPAVQESIKSISAMYTAEELITKRQEVSLKMQKKLEEKVEKYGLLIDNFNITNFNFSDAFNQAIEEKQVAEQKVATAKNALEKARIEAEQKIVEAQASAEANKLMERSLTDAILQQRAIEKWNGQLPTYYSGDNLPIISIK